MAESKKEKKRNLLQRIIGWFADLFAWIKETLTDDEARKAMLMDLGLPPDTPANLDIPQDSLDSIDLYRKSKDPDEAAFLSVVQDIRTIIEAVKSFINAAGVSEDAARDEVSHRFFELMTVSYLRLHHPVLYWAAQPLGFIEESLTTHSTAKIYPDRLISFFKGIGVVFKDMGADLNTDENAKAKSDPILMPLAIALTVFDNLFLKKTVSRIESDYDLTVIDEVLYGWELLGDDPPLTDRVSDRALSMLLKSAQNGTGNEGSISFTTMLVPRDHGGPGVFIAFGGSGKIESQLNKESTLQFTLNSANAVDFFIGWDGAGFETNAAADAGASFSIATTKQEAEEPFEVGISERSRLEFGRLSIAGDLSSTGAGIKLLAENSSLVISSNDADMFVSEMLPKETRIAFNFGLGLSSDRGLYLEGGSGLRSIFPINKSLGPVRIQTMVLGVTPNTDHEASNLALEAAASLDIKLGPITATIDQIGFQLKLDFAKKDPNLGFADLSLGFKPPKGLGVSIDASGVTGGGFLFFDPDKHEYGGVLELQILEKISVKAMGVLTTKMPDGKGYSLVVLIFVEGFAPIQLGLGFSLTGIGGLFGLNRTFDEEALRSGLKDHALDSLMFPKDPVRNAPQIISNISRVFPPARGHHLFGPMVQIAWGTPPLITAELALLLEFGERLRLIILAQITALLPTRENDLVHLQLDAFGVIDFDRGTASLDASLYGSRLVKKFVLTGDMAMRLSWESPRNFALAVGGLHPAYNPPPNFPKLERIAIDLSAGDNPRFRCEAYFAITSNTLQFGARAELYAEAVGFSINGEVGFDVLIQRDPFYFIAEFNAQVQLKRGTKSICKVTVDGALTGPRPLHVRGKATIEVLWWDVSVSFDKTLLKGEKPPSALPINVLPLLKEALRSPGNWVGTLPNGRRQMATFRNVQPVKNAVLLHPLGTLTVKQSVVPLNTPISRVGSAPLQGANVFTIEGVSLGTITNTVTDFFAPAQFFEMSDDAKLASPSFESMPAGVKFASDSFSFPTGDNVALETDGITFETHTITIDGTQPLIAVAATATQPYQLPDRFFARQYMFGAAGESELRRVGREKYTAGPGKFESVKEGWGVVDVAKSVPSTSDVEERLIFKSYSEARRIAREEERLDPLKSGKVKVMRPSELK